ncbi:LysM peptidoglycan-binding domain-containing protein [Vibrio sp. Vb2880]|uniref:Murein transglycosylase n=1 Tax=Vibrio furnissii TaxID=29494 RepID=A0A0Q2SCI9_VIBFU|nr:MULTISPECIES: LysM peptidoglycan-binding domain-containing protein [Vibrio]KQH85139.1 murein transglycosylase [Vibrio furnissii]MBO0212680.1 LysM peptidoglycan-binding domain-containing protein [Vibrio sp. Vb2880]MCG6213476.1 LysM peptidoglycan-binding domain-containing protein [Vibrio furnissii]MCG6230001.1 LysM peptidoglycan-binding domain-containing protein [Vibrio furnissii]MCG6266221.1 LysM peptidoglycan-binding domain-containing protein [Vibrio furnissii]
MRVQFSWVIALLLAGCQLTQPLSQNTSETNEENTPASQVTPPTKPKKTPVVVAPKVLTPQEQDDVWQRIAMQLQLPIPDDKTVDYYRTWYIKHPGHLEIVAKRAEPFLYLITEKIEQRNLPLELALLPIVESSFDAFAYSHGSAAGLWQFVPGTGKMYGLEQNFWYDGRRDVDAATDAALDYLTYLSNRFNGDWYNAIAAYNSGGGRVSSAIRKNTNLGKPTDFFSLDLPKETSGYVPKLLALADIIANQERYGVSLRAIANKPVLKLVDPEEQLDLAIAANYAGISVKELQSYNPAYNQWATAPDGPFQLLLPIDTVARFQQNVEENRGKGMKLVRYKVKSGDTLSVIATKHSTTTKVIQTANNLSGTSIRVGQYLMIPTSVKDEKAYALSASNRLAKTQSLARGKYKLTHTVRSGDSLWTIARANNVSHQALAKWNGMGPRDTLRVGQKLVIWKDSTDGAIIRTVFYQVRNGDTLSDIAARFSVKTHDIVKWNDLANQKYLKPGQKLKLYVDVTKVSV